MIIGMLRTCIDGKKKTVLVINRSGRIEVVPVIRANDKSLQGDPPP
jgi:hypothetical protein